MKVLGYEIVSDRRERDVDRRLRVTNTNNMLQETPQQEDSAEVATLAARWVPGTAIFRASIVAVTIVVIAVLAAQEWLIQPARELDERIFLAAADAVRSGVAGYYLTSALKGSPHLPVSLDQITDLVNTVDPWTGKADWGLIRDHEGGILGIYSRSTRPLRVMDRLQFLASRRPGVPDREASSLGASAWVFYWQPPSAMATPRNMSADRGKLTLSSTHCNDPSEPSSMGMMQCHAEAQHLLPTPGRVVLVPQGTTAGSITPHPDVAPLTSLVLHPTTATVFRPLSPSSAIVEDMHFGHVYQLSAAYEREKPATPFSQDPEARRTNACNSRFEADSSICDRWTEDDREAEARCRTSVEVRRDACVAGTTPPPLDSPV